MKNLIELQDFYKTFNREMEPVLTAAGHFNIFRVEDLLLPQQKPVTYTRRNFFKVSLVSGHSRIHYADQTIETTDTVLFFTNPMIPFFWERVGPQHAGFVCIFTEAFFSPCGKVRDYPVFQSAGNAVIPFAAAQAGSFTRLFEKMWAELQGEYRFKYDLLLNLLLELIHTAQKQQPATGSPVPVATAAERIASLFTELLERQFPIELSNQVIRLHTPAQFARQLNIHVNHLNKALRERTGQTTTRLINARMLQEACILLKSTSWSINEIAWSLGFEEPNHFSTFFKTGTGLTPKQFRVSQAD